MNNKHLIDLDDFSVEEINEILNTAKTIMKKPEYFSKSCQGKIMATLFYEPSTRTQMSFQTAMLRLGGQIIGFDNPGNSSVSKGESLKDTVRVISNYADIITIRHPSEGSAKAASLYSRSPVVNAGDGGHFHPTQTLTDLFTLKQTKGTVEGLKVGLCGDLLNGRTVHSLVRTLIRFPGNTFVLISTKELSLPQYIKDAIINSGSSYIESDSLSDSIKDLDVLYMTRIQQERFASAEEYEKQKGVFVLDANKLSKAKEDLKVLHPLPRVDEITVDVDDDSRAVYFDQTEYGMYARMALILLMLENTDREVEPIKPSETEINCSNPKCITHSENYLPDLKYNKDGVSYCQYCDYE